MAVLRPFRGLRYDTGRAGDLGRLIVPPFDVISPSQQQMLHDASPFNAVHLEYNAAPGEARYSTAASLLREWRASGALRAEEQPVYYLYEQHFQHAGRSFRRRTLFARVRVEPIEAGVIRPHEYTLSGPKADRLQLLQATRTNISPVFCLYRSEQANPLHRLAITEGSTGTATAVDLNGDRHLLSPIADPAVQRELEAYLAPRTFYIADGHHRYETALRYRELRRAEGSDWTGDEPENFVLMGLTAADDPGLLILPIHRIVHRAVDAGARQRIGERFSVVAMPGQTAGAETLAQALSAQASTSTVSFVAAGWEQGRLAQLTLRDRELVEAAMPAERSAAWKALDVSVLQYGVLEAGLGIDLDAIAGGSTVTFTEDAAEAVAHVNEGRAPIVFLVRPTRAEDIFAVADAGDRMPQKSTYFYPKLGTGLVYNSHDVPAE